MHLDEFLTAAVLLLGVSTAAVLLFQRAGFGSVLGLLVVGIVLGPHTIGPVVNLGPVAAAAELGVVFLLFVIGLELEPRRLWAMRSRLLRLGLAQVTLVQRPQLAANVQQLGVGSGAVRTIAGRRSNQGRGDRCHKMGQGKSRSNRARSIKNARLLKNLNR